MLSTLLLRSTTCWMPAQLTRPFFAATLSFKYKSTFASNSNSSKAPSSSVSASKSTATSGSRTRTPALSKKRKEELMKQTEDQFYRLTEEYKMNQEQIIMDNIQGDMQMWADDGHNSLRKEKFDKAIAYFSKIIDAEFPEGYSRNAQMLDYTYTAYSGRARAYAAIEKYQECFDDFQYILDNYKHDFWYTHDTYYDRATVYHHLENHELALADVNRILNRTYDGISVHKWALLSALTLRAQILSTLKRTHEAIEDTTTVLLSEKTADNYLFRAHLYAEIGQMEAAKDDIDTADKLGGDDADFWFTKAFVYIAVPGGEEVALKALKRALKLDPAAKQLLVEYPALAKLFNDRIHPPTVLSDSSSSTEGNIGNPNP